MYCSPKRAGRVERLDDAKKRCALDSSCFMFHSEGGDDFDRYFLCNRGSSMSGSVSRGKLYIKKGNILQYFRFLVKGVIYFYASVFHYFFLLFRLLF